MDKLQIVNEFLIKRKENLLKVLKGAKEARDNAPGAMESHSDTSRSQNEKLVAALEQQLKDLDGITEKIANNPSSLMFFKVNIKGEEKKFIIVPAGAGGAESEETQLLSEETPLGLELIQRKTGEKFDFNGNVIEILTVE